MSKHPITCHVLDTASGKPAAGIECTLYLLSTSTDSLSSISNSTPEPLGTATTNDDGRIMTWTFSSKAHSAVSKWDDHVITPGVYKIKFETSPYFEKKGSSTFFPFVEVVFKINNPPDAHYHVPLLLSNFSYSTYRGS